MSYNGSGTFTINSTGQPVVAGTVITASAFNALTADLATGLTTAITKDGQTTTTARITFAQGITSSLTTDSSSTSTGSIITAGGAGIAKNLYVGGIASFSAQPIFTSLTASSAVATDASKGLVSVTNTGTGNNVLGTAPTIASANLTTALTLTGASGTAGQALTSGGSGNAPTWTTIAATPGGSTTQVQYNSSGAFAGSANMTFSGTALTLANDASISGLTVGKGTNALSTNTALGVSALAASNSGTGHNVANGYQALTANLTGLDNTGVGYQALLATQNDYQNTAVGSSALKTLNGASNNTAVGYNALLSTTTGGSNVAMGAQALQTNTTNSYCTAVGYKALYASTGENNTGLGFQAGLNNSTGTQNVFVGGQCAVPNTTGSYNVGVGCGSLGTNTTGSNNTAVGYNAGNSITVNSSNTCIGYDAGSNITTGIGNIHLGYSTRASAVGVNYEIVIGTSPTGKGGNTGYINPNGGGNYQGNNSLSWSVTSDQRIKKNIVNNNNGLDIINQIQVRNFEYRLPEEIDAELSPTDAIKKSGVQLGVIAQELKEILPECVKTESTGVMTVDADNLTWYLVNAVKELTARIKQLEGN